MLVKVAILILSFCSCSRALIMKGSSLLPIGLVALSVLPSLGIKLPILKRDVHSSRGFSAAMRYSTQRAGDDPDAIDLMNGGNLLVRGLTTDENGILTFRCSI